MYFTYSQLWLPVVVKAFYDDFIRHREAHWVKTERFTVSEAAIASSVSVASQQTQGKAQKAASS